MSGESILQKLNAFFGTDVQCILLLFVISYICIITIYIIISTHAYLQIWVALIWLSQKICKNVQYKRTFMFWSYLLCCKHLNEAEQPWLNGNDAHLYLICWVWNRCIHTLRLDTVFLWGLTGESAHALFISGNQFLHKLKKLKPSSK